MPAADRVAALGPDGWEAWDRFLEATPDAGFLQSSAWAAFRGATGYDYFGLVVRQRRAIVGGALVLKRRYAPGQTFYYVPEGPVLPRDAAIAEQVFTTLLEDLELLRRVDRDVVSHLRIEPRWQRLPSFVRGFRELPPFPDIFVEPRQTLCIDLRASDETLLSQMKPKGRYNVRLALRHGARVVEDTSARGLADFLRIYAETNARQQLPGKPRSYFRRLAERLLTRSRGSIFFTEYRGERLATAIVLFFGERATYFFGGSLGTARRVMAPYALHFEIMRQARSRGHVWYDLWGVAPRDATDHGWRTISDFKRKFGGVEVRLVPTLDLIYDAEAYKEYLAATGADPAAGS